MLEKRQKGNGTSTSTSQTSTTSGPSSPACKAQTLDSGDISGIAIGSAVFGALLTLLIFAIFMKRSKRSGGGKGRHSRTIDVEKSAPLSTDDALEENLLERADDSQIRKSIQNLGELIDQHVENYYHLQPFQEAQGTLGSRLIECGYDTDSSVQDMISVLKNPKTRFVGIRQLIAMVIVKNVNFTASAELSLLPPHIAGIYQSVPPVEGKPGCEEVFDKAFIKWRRLTALLLSPTRANREPPKANRRELQSAISQNVALINSVLKPFIKPGPDVQRFQEDNLSGILFDGAQLGLLLFCQPSVWVFNWKVSARDESSGRGKDGTQVTTTDLSTANGRPWVVFPGIGEKVERHGRQKVREINAPTVV